MTNGDKIRQMSNEEIAEYLDFNRKIVSCDMCVYVEEEECDYKCKEGIKAYLDMEVEE